jgi:hypothetical protein
MAVYFVGDKPSSKNKESSVAFVGTKSYKKLLTWIYNLDLDLNHVYTCNKDDIADNFTVEVPGLFTEIDEEDSVIALGEASSKRLDKIGLKHFKMPHPSGLNRKLNNKEYELQMLKQCKEYIGDSQGSY